MEPRTTTHWCAILLVASLPGCGSSSQGSGSGPSARQLGAPCSTPSDCASNVCLELVANDQGVPGLCTAECGSAAGCANPGACVPEMALGQNVCFRSCSSATDCAQNVPCIWAATVDGGICSPVPTTVCTTIQAAGGCEACVGANCCGQLKACVEDVDCSKLQQSCPGDGVCMQSSTNAAAQAFQACAMTSCTSTCQ